ncbi:MAG TPA: tagaturonate reductase [Terriglobales bacterium]|nr:tagaturonate reductase [Terriglobales bacterium]
MPAASLLSAPETILQIGSGAFLKGFVEDFVQLASIAGNPVGRVVSVQRKSDHRSAAFLRQDGLYTLILRGLENGQPVERKRIITSISRSLSADTEWNKVIAMAVRPSTRVIVSNVTESGLALGASDTPADQPPLSFPGKLTQLLHERWQSSGGHDADVAVVPCELVENNGSMLRKLIDEQARAWNLPPAFSDWLQSSVHFANTLVDRIVTGPPPLERLEAEWQALGYRDDLIVCAEPFALFVLEADEFVRRNFPNGKASPAIRFVDDLTPYRVRKVRILNGSHTMLAAIGRLLGLRTVREGIDDRLLGKFVESAIFQEMIPATEPSEEAESRQYAGETLVRFRNPFIEHSLGSICSNCSTKVGTRLFPAIRSFMERRGEVPRRLLFGVAAVILLLRDSDVEDTHLALMREMWAGAGDESPDSTLAFAKKILAKQVEWSREQIDLQTIAPEVARFLTKIREQGLRATMESSF